MNSDKQVAVYDSTVSARTYLSYISEQAGGFACIGRDGKLYIRTIGESIAELPIKYLQKFSWGEKFKLGRIYYEDGIQTFEAGDKTNNTVYICQDNMYIVEQEQIDNIYNKLNGLEVYGFEGDSIIDPALDIGDLLLIDGKYVIYQGSSQYCGKWKANISSKIQCKAKEETTTRTVSEKTAIRRVQSQINQIDGEITTLVKETTTAITTIQDNIVNLQAQIDGAIQFWNGSEIPTVSNYPASEWKTEADKNNHRADIYTVIEDVDGELKQGKSYRFDKVGDTWQWIELTDNELSAVQALATSKAKVFVATPTVPYNVGDLWLNNGKLYRCKTAKDSNGSYSSADWEIAVDYTDDTVAELAKTLANNAQSTADNAVDRVNNITNTQGEAEGKNIHIEDSAEEPFVDVELYGESIQEGTPTPDSPSEIENVEGNIEFKVEEKNRFKPDILGWILVDGSITTEILLSRITEKILCKEGEKFSLSWEASNLDTNIGVICFFDSAGNKLKRISTTTKTQIQGVAPSGTSYVMASIYNNSAMTNYQLELGEPTDYEPYKSQVAYFPLAEGEKLYQGSFLNDNGKNHERKQVIFDGTENWGYQVSENGYNEFYISLEQSPGNTSELQVFSNCFPAYSRDNLRYTDLGIAKASNYLRIHHPTFTTVTEFKTWLADLYSNGVPMIAEFVLAEPEVVPYTEEQQEAWNKIKALMTYKNITNITSDAYAKIVYMRDNGLDVYETKQNAQKRYTETSEKLTEQKMTVDGVITQVSDITSKTDELTGEVKTINSEISTVKQTIEGWSSELKNTGGNNIFYYSLDFWDNSNGLKEYSDTDIMQNSIGQTGYVLNNGSAKQTQSVKNGFYTCSFNYKKLLELAVCQVKINGITYDLTETDWAEFEQVFEVKTNVIEIELISDTDNSLYISDLMVNVGTTKLSWSQNANETRTDTVTIGKGIQVNSSAKNTYHRIDADGNRTFNKTTGKVVNEATDKGSEMEELVVRGQAKITGLLLQKVSDQVWINSLL